MDSDPTRLAARRPRALTPSSALSATLVALALASCGSDDKGGEDALALPTNSDADSGGWVFVPDDSADVGQADAGEDATSPDAASQDAVSPDAVFPDAVSEPVDAAATDMAADTGGEDSGSSADAGGAITSCEGHCGLFLEGNPCHCHHACFDDGSCCGGSGAYLAVCACNGDLDCDDGSPCTIDTCQAKTPQKLCMNLPFEGCCKADADCQGGDGVCSLATCLDGSCTVLKKKCDDGVDCSVDSCDPATGDCQHVLPKTACYIDGGCWKAGDAKPGSGGCQRCEPAVDAKAWTAKPGSCFIDGACFAGGAKASDSANECRVCVPDKASDAWSVLSGNCLIAGQCYPDGASSPSAGCEVCNSAQAPLAWSGKTGTCAIAGACYQAGAQPDGASCASCKPGAASGGWSVEPGQCFIDGACVLSGAIKPGSGGCEVCDPLKSALNWTAKPGQACDDGDPCTTSDACTSQKVCKGKLSGKPCCKNDDECALQVQPAVCEKAVCKGDGTCALAAKDDCCLEGVCCDTGNQVFKAKGTVCQVDSKKTEYKCEGGDGYARDVGYGCTGDHANKCVSSITGYGPWKLFKDCEPPTACKQSNPSASPVCQ